MRHAAESSVQDDVILLELGDGERHIRGGVSGVFVLRIAENQPHVGSYVRPPAGPTDRRPVNHDTSSV